VLDVWQRRIFLQSDFNAIGQRLLAAQHHSMLDCRVQIALADFRRMRPCRHQRVGDDVVDARDFLANLFGPGPKPAKMLI
jgi:hypothetical protein